MLDGRPRSRWEQRIRPRPKQPLRSRRAMLAGIAGAALGTPARPAAARQPVALHARAAIPGTVSGAFPGSMLLLVAGPDSGETAGWAGVLAPALLRGFPPGTQVSQNAVGGADGVTGANQFEALNEHDGATALLVPGFAALAWLVGDPRAQYDASSWILALSAVSPGVLASRKGLDALRAGQDIRFAASGPAGPELSALLALELLGARVTPVFGLTDDAGVLDAVASGAADAAYLHGRRVRESVPALAAAGAPPVLTMGAAEDQPVRDPMLPGTPAFGEIAAGRPHKLLGAWRAASAASQTEVALVLPQLTPAAAVALWRRSCAHATAAQDVQDAAADAGGRTVSPPGAGFAADRSDLLALRSWLADRWRWHPA